MPTATPDTSLSQAQFDRTVTDFRRAAGVIPAPKVEFRHGAFVVLTGQDERAELAMYRIADKFHTPGATHGYSANLKSFYFRLAVSGFSGEFSTQ